MKLNNPIPHSLRSEAKKAANILRDFSIPNAKQGPDGIIPAGILMKAEGLAILTVFKIGFLVTARGGSGIVIARLEDRSWSAPSAIALAGLGGGFEVGAEVTDFVIVLNTRSAVDAFSKGGNLTLGGNFTIAAGPIGRNIEGDVSVRSPAAIFTYSKTKGLFAGISIEGSYLVERKDANKKFYHQDIRAYDILSGGVPAPRDCEQLYSILTEHQEMYERQLMAAAKKAAVKGAHVAAERSGFFRSSVRSRSSKSTEQLSASSRIKSNSGSNMAAAADPYSSAYPVSWRDDNPSNDSDHETPSRSHDRSADGGRPMGGSVRSAGGDSRHGRSGGSVRSGDSGYGRSGASGGGSGIGSVGGRSGAAAAQGGISKSQSSGGESWGAGGAGGGSRPKNRDPRAVVRSEEMAPSNDKIFAVQGSAWDEVPTCRALWPFRPQMPCDLHFDSGDVIEINTRTETQNDWWEGTVNGRTGIFPANYVQVL